MEINRRPRNSYNGEILIPTILIIDDETNIRKMLQLSLERFGYNIQLASSGEEGLTVYGDGSHTDLILLDYQMPGLNGIDTLRALLKVNSEVKVILISGTSSINLAIEAIDLGARDFLRKPFSPEAIRSAVTKALSECQKDAPIASVCREFTRTNINGFNFELAEGEDVDQYGDLSYAFTVYSDRGGESSVRVVLPALVQELILAHIDADQPPCGHRLWEAACEERLAAYLWEYGEVPESGELHIEDVSDNMKLWLNSILTVSLVD